jgi:hypothetical protein
MSKVLAFYSVTFVVFFCLTDNLLKNKRDNFIFIENPKNSINDKIYIFSLNNIHILFKDNFRNLINQVLTWLFQG